MFTQFRLGNTKLPIETDRWFNIDRIERYCICICICVIEMRLGMNFIYCFNVTL